VPEQTTVGLTRSGLATITQTGRSTLGFGAAILVLCVAYLIWPEGRPGDATYLGALVLASLVAWFGALRCGGAYRYWIAAGVSASAVGDLLYEAYVAWRGFEPDVSIADIPWLLSYIGVGVGVLRLLRSGRRTARTDLDGVIDMAVVMLVAVLVMWHFWLEPTLSDGSVPIFVRSVWAAYPILDAALLAIVLRVFVERRTTAAVGLAMVTGVACWLIADFAWMAFELTGFLSDLSGIGWMLGAAFLAGACWHTQDVSPAPDASEPDQQLEHGVGSGRILLAITPLLVPGLIAMTAYLRGQDANPVPLFVGTVAFAGLAAARALRLLGLRDEAETRLASSERLYRALAANSSDAVILLDQHGVITNSAPTLAAMLGHPGETTKGRRALDFVASDDPGAQAMFDQSLLAPCAVLAGETHVVRPDGDLWLSTRAVNLLHDPDVQGIVVNVHDITDRKRAEDELMHQAFHDSLTGLANRALFRDRVEHALSRRARSALDPAVIYLDLDGFKNINDGLGHDAGDHLLREVARRLQVVVRSGDTVARLGGDEFAILVEESSHVQIEAEAIAERALQALTVPVHIDGHDVTISASLGIARGDAEATGSSLLRDADVAMYQTKTTGKAGWVMFEPTMRAAAVERLQLENDMAQAIANDQFTLVYQPVVALESNRVVGFEALLRWQHPELGLVMPDQFIPIAEDNGMIIPIGRWVLRDACNTAAIWRRRHGDFTMAVNLSARQLTSAELLDDVRQALQDSGLAPSALVLEMTETALVQDAPLAAARLHELRTLGVRLAIDDFGTGYSSLSYLRQFPVDILKIDRSFINTITDREQIPAIVRGLLDLGRTLQLETVAEGIESEAQLDQLRDQHCELGQGFLFARPMPADEAEKLLSAMTATGA
jgi:diguanylate cyclase (GGDEF)-like protein/PAS domain S-box-containing protein